MESRRRWLHHPLLGWSPPEARDLVHDGVLDRDPGGLLEAGGRRRECLRAPALAHQRPRVLADPAERGALLSWLWRGDPGPGRVPPESDPSQWLHGIQPWPLLQRSPTRAPDRRLQAQSDPRRPGEL